MSKQQIDCLEEVRDVLVSAKNVPWKLSPCWPSHGLLLKCPSPLPVTCFLYTMSFCQGISVCCDLTAHPLAQCPTPGRKSCSILLTQSYLTSGPLPWHTRGHHFVQLPFDESGHFVRCVTHNVFVWPCHWLMAFCDTVMPPVILDTAEIGHQDKHPCLSALE